MKALLQVPRDLAQCHVLAVFIEPEPGPAIRREKPGIADTTRQAIDGVALAHEPCHADHRDQDQRSKDEPGDPIAPAVAPGDHRSAPCPGGLCGWRSRRRHNTSDRMV